MTRCRRCNVELVWDFKDRFPSGKPKPKEVMTGLVHKCPYYTYAMKKLEEYEFCSEWYHSGSQLIPFMALDSDENIELHE